FVRAFPGAAATGARHEERPDHAWLTLLRQRAFVCVTLVAALILGSHAMYDSFAVIRWREAGISAATIGVLWSESVAGEVLVFLLIGTTLLRVLNPTGALALAAFCGVVRWGSLLKRPKLQRLHWFSRCTDSPLRSSTSHPCASSPPPYRPLWPEQHSRSMVLLALAGPQPD